ncbi:hypothetical protein HED48_23410 [Ochrobactrum intermedium]|nr:hypothetical protein [Brucella intermedia]
MMALTSGVTGIFGFNAAMIALGMLFGDDDDPFEFETKVKKPSSMFSARNSVA